MVEGKDVEYEWKVESIDGEGEIVDTAYFDRLADAMEWIEANPPEDAIVAHAVALTRNQFSHEGAISRTHVYVESGRLPSTFDDSHSKVPVRFHREVRAYFERV